MTVPLCYTFERFYFCRHNACPQIEARGCYSISSCIELHPHKYGYMGSRTHNRSRPRLSPVDPGYLVPRKLLVYTTVYKSQQFFVKIDAALVEINVIFGLIQKNNKAYFIAGIMNSESLKYLRGL